MNDNDDFLPDWASPPGDTIVNILEDKGMSLAALAEQLEMSIEEAIRLTLGVMDITEPIATKLAESLGSTTKFWLNRERQYRSELLRLTGDTHGDPDAIGLE